MVIPITMSIFWGGPNYSFVLRRYKFVPQNPADKPLFIHAFDFFSLFFRAVS